MHKNRLTLMKKLYLILSIFFIVYLQGNEHTVSTTSGDVSGIHKNRVIIWEDIPYAKPPVGALRWKAPREITIPRTINPINNNFCVQRPSSLGGVDGNGDFVGNEDCLYLDVFAPKKADLEKLPVMFWIHGGGNTSGLKDLYDFTKMVRKHNVIVVRINYRLGPFGWFYHPAIQNMQTELDKTSNFGTLDIIAALKWVQNNISLFNGDKENVTIFGESAGGHNVLSLIGSKKAEGLFHKAISMSGYTTSITIDNAYRQKTRSSTSDFSSWEIVNKIIEDQDITKKQSEMSNEEIRKILKGLSTDNFFRHYVDRKTYQELPLTTSDGIVISENGLQNSLSNKDHVNMVPIIAGSNLDEVKLWLSTAEYFIDVDYSFIGSIIGLPKVVLKDKDAFEAFNYYRSMAWKLRGVNDPLNSFLKTGNNELYAYRFDWDDHRRLFVADFKNLIGAAHATEIPLLTGSYDLVGGYPLSDLIYPSGISKFYTSRNMMRFWTNFAKNGVPGKSTNGKHWISYNKERHFMIIDNKRNMDIQTDNVSYESLVNELYLDKRVSNLEKCVILLQMFTFVGNDIYESEIKNYPGQCDRKDSEKFLIDNASFIDYAGS